MITIIKNAHIIAMDGNEYENGMIVFDDKIIDELIELCGGHTGFDMLAAVPEGRRADGAGTAHPLQLFGIFDLDQCSYASTPIAARTAFVFSASVGWLSTTVSLPRSL